ncbi:MAG: CocE/NonD family hydrolase [Planctomycetia bacterium]|nr:CocE/NonD family hydrolase [Planctomycetia bacterium]
MRRPALATTALALALAPAALPAQGLEDVKARYTKHEYRIPARDGARLFTAVYAPKDDSKRYPILLTRTPYNVQPYGVDKSKNGLGPSPLFGKEGYIFAYQDVRGRWMSEGTFVNVRPEKDGASRVDESTDTYDAIDWLVKNVANNNGRVGMYGISYPGFYTAAGLIDAHPALKAASPQAPVIDWFVGDDWHHNGAFLLTHCFNFLSTFGHPRPEPTKRFDHKFDHGTPDGYEFFLRMGTLADADRTYFKGDVAFWNEVMAHGTYDDWWKARNLRPHLKGVKPAVMTVGGWFDAENLFGALECYKAIEAASPGASNMLVMGPWFHGGWAADDGRHLGPVPFDAKTSEFYREKVEFPFFEHHLKGKPPARALPEAVVFETGTNRWRELDAWPPKGARARSLYLREGGVLAFEPPGGGDSDTADEYVSDPARPVPYLDAIANTMVREYMVADQRFAARRTDVLTYRTPPLDDDLTVAGPVKVRLHVSTTGTDSDWVVKLIDVWPDDAPDPNPNPSGVRMGGYQQLVRGDVIRGKFRDSLERPEPFTPGEPAEVPFTMPDACHTFRAGHRVMVQVQSSWFPLIDRNPQTFVDIYKAAPADFRKATQRVYRSKGKASRLEVLIEGE